LIVSEVDAALAAATVRLGRIGRMLGLSSALNVVTSAVVICAIVIAAMIVDELWPPRATTNTELRGARIAPQ
jgi:hypothetical protein